MHPLSEGRLLILREDIATDQVMGMAGRDDRPGVVFWMRTYAAFATISSGPA